MKITDLLSHGQANAVPLRDLEGMTGLDGRTVRAMISAERRAGAAILSDNATGYYLPANEEEKARLSAPCGTERKKSYARRMPWKGRNK